MHQGNTAVIERYLEPGEELLWAGQPPRGLMYRSEDLIVEPLGLMFLLYAISLQLRGLGAADGPIGLLYALPLTLLGLYITVGRFILDARLRGNTYYGITDRRIIFVGGFNGKSVKTKDVRNTGPIAIDDSGTGWGSVTFGSSTPEGKGFASLLLPGLGKGAVFEDVPRIHDVTFALERARAAV